MTSTHVSVTISSAAICTQEYFPSSTFDDTAPKIPIQKLRSHPTPALGTAFQRMITLSLDTRILPHGYPEHVYIIAIRSAPRAPPSTERTAYSSKPPTPSPRTKTTNRKTPRSSPHSAGDPPPHRRENFFPRQA
ncbi:hypothetical protein EYC84_007870 [Monilinia fructicola]|uniref:Uncharacterized protein n=1 Tax=Monilinia fructicola TaxID=38448 RepID=A0A5M9JHW6_MONFR|nr:hypothetical protein EYC84_007870 [Monilinia fructicola]